MWQGTVKNLIGILEAVSAVAISVMELRLKDVQ